MIENQCARSDQVPALADLAGTGRSHCFEVAGAMIVITGNSDADRIGRVRGFGVNEPATKAGFKTIFAFLDQEKPARVRFRVPPTNERQQVISWLEEKGFKRITFLVQWLTILDPERPVETEHRIQPIGAEHAGEFARIIAENYRTPGQEALRRYEQLVTARGRLCYMAFDGKTPIGTGITYVDSPGCILAYATTIKPYRKQGLQKAMIGYRLNEARKAGCEWGCASTIGQDRSSRNLQRQGFTKAYDEIVYGIDTAG